METARQRHRLRHVDRIDAALAHIEAWLVAFALAVSAALATAAMLARNLGLSGSPWLDLLPRFATLAIGFIGAGLASRLDKHIAIDFSARLLPPRLARASRIAADTLTACISAWLAKAAVDLIVVERDSGTLIAGSLPSWIPQCVLAWGFGIIALRTLLRAAQSFPPSLAVVPGLFALHIGLAAASADAALYVAATGAVAAAALGAPIFAVIGGGALLLFWSDGADLAVVPIEVYRLTEAPAIVTLPLFTLVGAILAKGDAPKRLVDIARAGFGWFPGGLALATVIVSAFFTTFTGASGITILALGVLLQRLLRQERYPEALTTGLITSSGSIGLLFAPALPLIIYGIVAKVDIDHMFLAGIVPGCVLLLFVGGTALWLSRRSELARHRFDAAVALRALRRGAWDLCLPFLVLGLYLTGLASVAEAAAVGLLYVTFVSLVVHRDVRARDLVALAEESAILVGAVLVIMGASLALTYFLVDHEVPQILVEWAKGSIANRTVFLLALNGLLLVVGCLLDIFSAIVIFVPLLAPVAEVFAVDPVHLGIIFLTNLEIGYLTPPVGMNLFLASFRFNMPLPAVWKTTVPFLVALLAALIIITYWPGLSLWLVR